MSRVLSLLSQFSMENSKRAMIAYELKKTKKYPQGDYLPDLYAWSDDLAKINYEFDYYEDKYLISLHHHAQEMYTSLDDIRMELKRFRDEDRNRQDIDELIEDILEMVSVINLIED